MSRTRQRQRQRARLLRQRVIVLGVGAAVLLGGGFAALARGGGDIPPGVSVAGVEVGGMSRAEAESLLRARAREMLDEQTVVESRVAPDFSRSVTRRELGGRPRIAATLDEAAESRGPLGRALVRLGIGAQRDIPLRFVYEAERVDALIAETRTRLDVAPTSASLEVQPARIVLSPSAPGRSVDAEELVAELHRFPRRIEAPVARQPAAVREAAAQAARERAQRLLDTPPTVILGTVRKSLTEQEIRGALRFREEPPRLVVALDPERLRAALGEAFAAGEREAVSAQFRIVGERVEITPSRAGRGVDMPRLARTLVARAGRPQTGARFTTIEPELTTAEARRLRITERVAGFTTPYACCPARVTNIQRGAEILDGTIIPAGGRFSLNESLGERTTERGFVAAGQIVNGRLEDAVGGGVSQIATTVFNAAFFAGLEVVTHTPHQFYISRYPEGREATISWGGPELIVRNDWPAAVLMKVSAGSAGITVNMYSTQLGRSVETEVLSREAGRAPRVVEKLDRSLPPGTRTVLQDAGAAGFTITYSRIVSANGEITRDETYRWSYSAQDAYVEKGPPKTEDPQPKDDPDTPREGADEPPAREGPPPPDSGSGTQAPDTEEGAGAPLPPQPAAG